MTAKEPLLAIETGIFALTNFLGKDMQDLVYKHGTNKRLEFVCSENDNQGRL